jgi:uncharacterized protein (DUF169 family)
LDIKFKEDFIVLWKRFFGEAELPITFYYTDEEGHAELVKPGTIARRCVIAALSLARKGQALCFDAESIGCFGGQKYLGFRETEGNDIEYFLSCGIPGKVVGERYKKSPEIVAEAGKLWPSFKAPGKFIVFKRWDTLNESDEPAVVIFFASPDVLSGLFSLANFDETESNEVFTPWGSGCSSIVAYPFLEKDSVRPRAVIGLFDVSVRPHVPENTLSFSVSMLKFEHMVRNMEESFLTTSSWKQVEKRIRGAQ